MSQYRRSREFQPEAIGSALVASHGCVTHAAARLGCIPVTIDEYAKREPDVAETLSEQCDCAFDLAESALFDAIKARQSWAIIFCLKHSHEGRARSYSERTEVAGVSDRPVNVTFNINRVDSREPEPFHRTAKYRDSIRDLSG
jgi:hypothetical protein